jgi:hypothetical protein
MNRFARKKLIWSVGATVLLAAAVSIWVIVIHGAANGDPGGKVMDQLTPTVSALPGYGTAALPWVNQIPQSFTTSYAIRMEPHQDSCDGIAGTQGWSLVVVQAGFKWTKGLRALVAFMEPRLKPLGWSMMGPAGIPTGATPTTMVQTNQIWTRTISNGSSAQVSVDPQSGYSSMWELVTTGQAIGKRVNGC